MVVWDYKAVVQSHSKFEISLDHKIQNREDQA